MSELFHHVSNKGPGFVSMQHTFKHNRFLGRTASILSQQNAHFFTVWLSVYLWNVIKIKRVDILQITGGK
jgi:hypothetical protein